MVRAAVVTTTIYVPSALKAYFANAVRHGHGDTLFVVTGDKKTPAETAEFLQIAAKEAGVECVYLDVEGQNKYMQKFPEMDKDLPWYDIDLIQCG